MDFIKRIWLAGLTLVFTLLCGPFVWAVEETAGKGSWTDFFYSEAFLGLIALVIGHIWARAKKMERLQVLKNEKYSAGVEFLEAGIKEVWHKRKDRIRQLKADGQFTDQEKKALEKEALGYAVDYAKEDGMDLLKVVSKNVIPVLIEKIVKSRKAPKV